MKRLQYHTVRLPEERSFRSDLRFFDRHPHRTHRIRRAFRGEVERLADAAEVSIPNPSEGKRFVMAVRRVSAGTHMRIPFTADSERFADEPGEDDAAITFAIIFRHTGGAL